MNPVMERPLRIGQFNDTFKPVMDGVGNCVENYARWLNQNHCSAVVVVPSAPGWVDEDPYTVTRYLSIPFPRMSPYRIGFPGIDFRFRRALDRTPFDLVHTHSPFVAGALARRAARLRSIPAVATFHSKYRDDALKLLGSPRLAEHVVRRVVAFYQSVDQVWAPNNATAATLREYGYKGPIEIVPNGTDLEIPSPDERMRARMEVDRLLPLKPDEPLYLFVGQHRWEKNVRLIIEALTLLKRRGVEYHMAFVGTGYAAQEMRRLVRDRGISDRVSFLGLIVDRQRLKPFYARADIFVFPSLYDNAPVVMREAAAYSCPSVLVEGSSAAENAVHGENAFLIQNRASALCDLLAQLSVDREAVRRAGIGARNTIYLRWEQVVAEVYDRYRQIHRDFRNRGFVSGASLDHHRDA
jgi:1,2-diacylglycerol 3-alpha-glucosyltransferase